MLIRACLLSLCLAAGVLVYTVLNVAAWLNDHSAHAELDRVSNAIGVEKAVSGRLTPQQLRRIAGELALSDWSVAEARQSREGTLAVPVEIEGLGARLLVWTAPRLGDQALGRFAPTRVPFILVAVAAVGALLIQLGRLASALERERLAARQVARSDALTGLANRLAFDEALADFDRDRDRGHLLLIDLDGFKQVNDRHGHAAGDMVLRVVGLRLLQIAGTGPRAFRLGGDEFALLADTEQGRAEILRIARDVVSLVAMPIDVASAGAVAVGASVGIAVLEGGGGDMRRFVTSADAALYAAKRDGESRIRFAPDMREHDALVGRKAA